MQITRPYSLGNLSLKLLVSDKLQRRLKEIAPLKQYFKRYKQQKMTFGKLLG